MPSQQFASAANFAKRNKFDVSFAERLIQQLNNKLSNLQSKKYERFYPRTATH
jgi:hypothetical protein